MRPVTVLEPWSSEHLLRVVGGNALGVVVIVTSWFQASGELSVPGQLTWLNVGLVGLGVAGVSNGVWLYRGRREVGARRRLLLPANTTPEATRPADADGDPVAGDGMSRYHEQSCPFARDRAVRAAPPSEHREAGLLPCEVCLPEVEGGEPR